MRSCLGPNSSTRLVAHEMEVEGVAEVGVGSAVSVVVVVHHLGVARPVGVDSAGQHSGKNKRIDCS